MSFTLSLRENLKAICLAELRRAVSQILLITKGTFRKTYVDKYLDRISCHDFKACACVGYVLNRDIMDQEHQAIKPVVYLSRLVY